MLSLISRTYPRPRLVISRCIEFDHCRYDGSKISSPTVASLKQYTDCIPVCPEVEIGLGTPRSTVRIVRMDDKDHLMQPATGRDVTDDMNGFISKFLDDLPPVDGFILKTRSPTSGTGDVRVYRSIEKSQAIGKAAGFFGREVLRRFPHLPVEDEQRLNNARIRDHFFTAIFTLASFRAVQEEMNPEALMKFHSNNKLQLMAIHQQMTREIGQLVASRAELEPADLFGQYLQKLCAALAQVPHYTNNINVLHHVIGHFRDRVTSEEKAYCLRLIERYREGHATLNEPRDLLRSWVIRFQEPTLLNQTFFAPYPVALADLPEEIIDRGRDIWKNRGGPAGLEEKRDDRSG